MNREVLEEIILNVNARTGIRNDILEKDYYVCLVLKDLATKQKDLQAYFKGGTALYKILNHMNRFSEDIDLTVKINEFDSNNSNRQRLKKAALGYEISGLELIKSETVDRKGSITSFYRYDSLFSFNELFKSGKVQIEATSFTISEPLGTYFIEPLIYKYASDHEKKILKNVYQISEFSIEIIMLERILLLQIRIRKISQRPTHAIQVKILRISREHFHVFRRCQRRIANNSKRITQLQLGDKWQIVLHKSFVTHFPTRSHGIIRRKSTFTSKR